MHESDIEGEMVDKSTGRDIVLPPCRCVRGVDPVYGPYVITDGCGRHSIPQFWYPEDLVQWPSS
jgi:hypothetical protein